eukprot:SAG31_NODE_6630_length_1944_cov_2.072629_1_plen_73_part_00
MQTTNRELPAVRCSAGVSTLAGLSHQRSRTLLAASTAVAYGAVRARARYRQEPPLETGCGTRQNYVFDAKFC